MRLFVAFIIITLVVLNQLVLWRNKSAQEREEEERRRFQCENLREICGQSVEQPNIISAIISAFSQKPTLRSEELHKQAMRLRNERRIKEITSLLSPVQAVSGTISHVVGVFKQVSTVGEPIFKHVSGGTWGMRQINTVGEPIFKPNFFGSTLKGLGWVVRAGAAAFDFCIVMDAANEDLNEGGIKNTVHASSVLIGGWTGASYGASLGAALLSFIPVVGTLVGGVAGGMLGSFAGSTAAQLASMMIIG